jgi:hypothetical protein
MTLNCSILLSTQIMTSTQLDNNYNADLLDAMADMAYEQEQAMRESSQSDWTLVDRTDGITSVDLINQTVDEWEGVIYDDEDAP